MIVLPTSNGSSTNNYKSFDVHAVVYLGTTGQITVKDIFLDSCCEKNCQGIGKGHSAAVDEIFAHANGELWRQNCSTWLLRSQLACCQTTYRPQKNPNHLHQPFGRVKTERLLTGTVTRHNARTSKLSKCTCCTRLFASFCARCCRKAAATPAAESP